MRFLGRWNGHHKVLWTVATVSLLFGYGPSVSMATGEDPVTHAVSQVADMSNHLFINGANAAVLAPGTASDPSLVAGAAELSSFLHAPLLLTETPDSLGPSATQALNSMAVAPTPYPMPGALMPGKPMLYVVGDNTVISQELVDNLKQLGYQVQRVKGTPNEPVIDVIDKMVHPPLPSAADASSFPDSWLKYAYNLAHNPAFPAAPGAPEWVRKGVSWAFPENMAVPLQSSFPDQAALGLRGAPVKMTQMLGNAVGVTAVNGIIYAESDDGYLYALNAQTGDLLWESPHLINALMGDPVVADNLVFVTAGDTGFSFSQLLKYFLSGGKKSLNRGLGYAAIYAFDAQTGRQVWRQDVSGNAMSSPAVYNGIVYTATGDGHLYAYRATTGDPVFQTDLGGFDSMSSLNLYLDPKTFRELVLVGVSDQNRVVAVDAYTGKIVWTQATNLKIFNTGMGDNSPAVDQENGIVVQDSVVDGDPATQTSDLGLFAMDVHTGKVLWSDKLGRGPTPPAYKAGITMIHQGIIYVGTPITSKFYAVDEKTGNILWTFQITDAGPAGAGRGGAVYYQGVLWLAAGPSIYALDPSTGRELSSYKPGGRFGIVNPVIVGGTMYLDNSYDWVQAIPLSTIYPGLSLQ